MNLKNNILFSKKELLYFCIQRFAFGFSYSLMIPIIPLYFNSLGLSSLIIGVIMSSYGLSKALMQVVFGAITNKIGDKLLLIIAFILMAIIPFLYTLNSSSLIASIIYIAQGAILGMSAPAVFSLLARSLDEEKRGQCTGYASAVFTLSGAIASIIGGFIVTKLNNYNLVFYMSSIGIILTVVFIIMKIKKADVNSKDITKSSRLDNKNIDKCNDENVKDNITTFENKRDNRSNIENKKGNFKSKIGNIFKTIKEKKLLAKIVLLGIIALLGDFIYGCIVSIFPFYGQEVLGSSAFYTSVIISVYLFIFGIFAPIGGFTSDKIGVKKQLFISFIFMIIALGALSIVRKISIFTVAIIIYFLGATFLNSGLQNSLLKFGEDKKSEGIVFGFVGACESLGYAVGPLISAYVYNLNKVWLFPGLFIFTVLVFVIFIFLRKKSFNTADF